MSESLDRHNVMYAATVANYYLNTHVAAEMQYVVTEILGVVSSVYLVANKLKLEYCGVYIFITCIRIIIKYLWHECVRRFGSQQMVPF